MAFNFNDFNMQYHTKGNYEVLCNVARTDEANDSPQYYLFLNDEGSYVIMKKEVAAGVTTYTYYAVPLVNISTGTNDMDTDWTNRASLTYKEYNEIL